jgi:hypothetical protein
VRKIKPVLSKDYDYSAEAAFDGQRELPPPFQLPPGMLEYEEYEEQESEE